MLTIAVEAFRDNSFSSAIERKFGRLARLAPEKMVHDGVLERLDHSPDDVLVAESSGKVVGFVIMQCEQTRKTGWIPLLAVAETNRRTGIGRALLKAALNHLRFAGMQYARIETLDTNEGSQRLFPQLGFQEFAREIQYFMKLDDD